MAGTGKISRQMEIKSSGDKYFQLFHKNPQSLTKISPAKVKSYELVQGQPGTVGCVTIWTYDIDGMVMTCKKAITGIDDKKRMIKHKFLEGEVMQMFKSFETTLQVNTVGTKDVVTLTLEFQKINESIKDPVNTMNFFMDMTKDIDTYHLTKA